MSQSQQTRPVSRARRRREPGPWSKSEAEDAVPAAMPQELEAWIAKAAGRVDELRAGGFELRFRSAEEAGELRIELRDARTGRLVRLIAPEEAVEIALGAPVG